ncbi:MAG: acyl carrier protein [Psychromonas sp.]|nr:acyl carrier protein [Psychromonas sp.]
MIGSKDVALKLRLKQMIIDECEKEDEINTDEIDDDVLLFSPESGLDLDSVDALQLSMSLQAQYGVRLADPKEFRRVVTSINGLADYLQSE